MRLRTVLGTYPHTQPLKRGEICSAAVSLDFVDITPTHKAFKPMVREQQFDVCEMAIVTYLQAKAHGSPLVLLPAVMLGRFQHHCIVYNAERGAITLPDLVGRRVGVRAYTQTTGVWLRGILANDYHLPIDRIRWVTFEDAHVAEYRDPPDVERADVGKDLTTMLLDGELDAAIYGAELPDDPRLQPLIRNPAAAAQAWYKQHRLVPINHMVVVTEALARKSPGLVQDVYDLLLQGRRAAVGTDGPDLAPFGIDATSRILELIVDYALQQQLIPRRLTTTEMFAEFIQLR